MTNKIEKSLLALFNEPELKKIIANSVNTTVTNYTNDKNYHLIESLIVEAEEEKETEVEEETVEKKKEVTTDKKGDTKNEKSSKDKPVETKTVSATPLTAHSVIEKLNLIRSGRSLKDKDINKALTDYFSNLDPAKKNQLFSFLSGLEDIIVGGEPAQTAEKPSEVLKPTKETDEDTSPPIKVGKKQTNETLQYAKSLMVK